MLPREVIFDLWPVLHDLVSDLFNDEDADTLSPPYTLTVERRTRGVNTGDPIGDWVVHAGADADYDDYRIRVVRQ